MKNLPLPPQLDLSQGGPRFWKSLEEWSHSAEFLPYLHREFPEHASEWECGLSRRRFLQLMGASLALAGLSSCSRQPQEKLVPYTQRPERIISGKSLFYATTLTHRGYGKGVLVRTEMARPTKIEGNADHPASRGATDSFMQAALLGLYDPDRSQTIRQGAAISSWDAFSKYAADRIAEHEQDQGSGLCLLTGRIGSLVQEDQIKRLQQRFPKATWCEYEPAAPLRARALSGLSVEPRYDLTRAKLIISLDADFLSEGAANLILIKDFSQQRRQPETDFNRLFVIESTPSITGSKADSRWRRRPSEIISFARELAQVVIEGKDSSSPEISLLAGELQKHRGESVVIPGDYQPELVQVLAFQLNQALGNIGQTVHYPESPVPLAIRQSGADFLSALEQGVVKTLLIADINPVYSFPPEAHFPQLLKRVPHAIHLGAYDDETGSLCQWHLPQAHELESWGDAVACDGTYSLIQPVIAPLYPSCVSLLEMLSRFVDSPPQSGYDAVRNFWLPRLSAEMPQAWEMSLSKGVLVGLPAVAPVADVQQLIAAEIPQLDSTPKASSFELIFRPDAAVDDGRFANNAWLQELPRPVSKITWDNVAMISPQSARDLGVESGQVIKIAVDSQSVEIPVWIQPGQADGCISLTLGYGRTRGGNIAEGVGVDVNPLRSFAHPWMQASAQVERTSRRHELACTQNHFSMEGRDLIAVQTLSDLRADPAKIQRQHPNPPAAENLYPLHDYKSYAWGMSVDLNTCVGCNACIVACQAENNIPVVGKEQVLRGREMHWLRVDRYFSGAPEEPDLHFQPVMCMQCEEAPCEVVCPVGATVHDAEGLNDMVYNRCVGTRYCSNNCPYKVRRFNFLEYEDKTHPTLAMQKNPNVTVRSRGVMEKCTYCVQRIEAARITSEIELRPVRDGEIVTACQAACPAEAIVFGNINNPQSRVSELKRSPRDYALLAELNTRPRTTYLAKITNPPEGKL